MSIEIKKYPEIGRFYEHYKGGKYEVISMAKHTETDEDLVVYKSIHFGSVYARPLSQWFEKVFIRGKGHVQRFEQIPW